jgi:hypothetical protein
MDDPSILGRSQTRRKRRASGMGAALTKIPFTKGNLLVGKRLDMCMLDDGLLLHYGSRLA